MMGTTLLYGNSTVGQSDLYCYFYTRALQLLATGGVHVFVCSNSWLDVGYGAKLQKYLLDNAHIRSVYESAVERQFSTADINTAISIISKLPIDEDRETKFVSLRDRFEVSLADPGSRREITRTRDALIETGYDGSKYVGDKWGNKYLRAPDIYHHLVSKYAGQLVRLADIATVRYGIITGANKFFYMTQDRINEWEIEQEFLQPVMTGPQESPSIAIDGSTLPSRIFMCSLGKKAISGTNALEYIRWGESQAYHEMSACRARKLWYDLGERVPAQLAINTLIGETARTFFSEEKLLFDQTLYTITAHDTPVLKLCGVMNSTLSQLSINLNQYQGGMCISGS